MAQKLTKRFIESRTYHGDGKHPDQYWDQGLRGFGIRVYPSGKKVFFIGYRINRRWRTLTIGSYQPLPVEVARQMAQALLLKVAKGFDPAHDKEKEQAKITLRDFSIEYLERYAKPHKKSWFDDEALLKNFILPRWKNYTLDQLTRLDVVRGHQEIGENSIYRANRMLSCLSKMYDCAKRWGYLEEDHLNPARGVRRFREKRRKRYLMEDELPNLLKSIDLESNPHVRHLFKLYLLTGLRKTELLTVTWSQVDLKGRVIRLSDSKNGLPHEIFFSDQALFLIKKLYEIRMEGNPYVFPSPIKKGHHLSSIKDNWNNIRERAGLPDLKIHDLRRTVGSWMVQSGVPLQVVSRVLNHQDISTTHQTYAHLSGKNIQNAMTQFGIIFSKVAENQNV